MYNIKKDNFLAYLNNPISQENIQMMYSLNNIKFEKCELYSDYIQSLLRLIFDTYLGDEITDIDNQIKHFEWCWDTNNDNFKKEGLFFNNEKMYKYFLEFMLEVYYSLPEKDNVAYLEQNILKLWYIIFDYNRGKTNSDIDTLIEIYKLLDDSFKIKND